MRERSGKPSKRSERCATVCLYEIDGAVVKLNRLSDREKCPDTSKTRGLWWRINSPPEEKESVLREVELPWGGREE